MRIGYAIKGRSWMYTHVVPRTADDAPRATVLNQWDLLAPLAIAPPDRARDPLVMVEEGEAAATVERRLRDARITAAHPLIVIHVSAGNPFRRWPRESFESLVVALARRDPLRRIILTSGPSDAAAAAAIADRARAALGRLQPPSLTSATSISPNCGACRTRGGVHWWRQRPAAYCWHHDDADRGRARADAGRTVDAVAGSTVVSPRHWTWVRSNAVRAVNANASRATSDV
jgi:hypothetical protein